MTGNQWADELKKAKSVLDQYEGEIEIWNKNYIAFKFLAPDYTLVFYPHKSSAGHYHLRVRLEGRAGRNLFKASEVMWRLACLENSCTFNVNNVHNIWGEDKFRQAIIEG